MEGAWAIWENGISQIADFGELRVMMIVIIIIFTTEEVISR